MFFSEFRRCSPVQVNGEEGPFVAAKRQALLPVERAILHPNHRLPAVLQKGLLKSHRNGRVHFQGKKGHYIFYLRLSGVLVLKKESDTAGLLV